jgi:hypothetical protein
MEVLAMPQNTERTGGHHSHTTTTCPPAYHPPAPNVLGRPSADQTEYFPAGATLGKKKKEQIKL